AESTEGGGPLKRRRPRLFVPGASMPVDAVTAPWTRLGFAFRPVPVKSVIPLLLVALAFPAGEGQAQTGVPGEQQNGAVFRPPYPPSPVLAGITFDDDTARVEAPGSDI